MRGLYIGRFQPYHLGHQAVLQKISEEVDEIVIVIGSAQESHTQENPFTAGERIDMIYAALGRLREKCYVIPLQDVKRNAIWVDHVRSMVPRFDAVYSNNPLVVQLFGEAGIEVRKPPMYQREIYSGTAIRSLMLSGGDWRSLLPEAVAFVVDEIGGVERLRNISCSDSFLDKGDAV
ncbi:MAG: nicotinamide-nucleotide adenylyltransferase [Methanotrichaceae archaeon]|nr:nicotinamide-nucleotide adenylyltransferase [Methanotrichaceae archaeon]